MNGALYDNGTIEDVIPNILDPSVSHFVDVSVSLLVEVNLTIYSPRPWGLKSLTISMSAGKIASLWVSHNMYSIRQTFGS